MNSQPGAGALSNGTHGVMAKAMAIVTTLNRAFDMLSAAIDLNETLASVLRIIKELLEAESCSLMTIEDATLRIIAAEGLDEEHVVRFNNQGAPIDSNHMAAVVAKTRTAFISGLNDNHEPFKGALVGKSGDTLSICIPIVSDDGKLWGVLSINLPSGPKTIEDWVVEVVTTVATTIANGMRRRERNRELDEFKAIVYQGRGEDSAIHALVKTLAGLATIGNFAIYLVRPGRDGLILKGVADSRESKSSVGREIPLDESTVSPLAQTAIQRKVVTLPGDDIKTVIIPLLCLGEETDHGVIGVLSVGLPSGGQRDEDIVLMMHIAEVMGMAIGRIRAEGQLHAKYIQTLMDTLATREHGDYTTAHSQGMTDIALAIAGVMGLGPLLVSALKNGCPLHDIGKIGVPETTLNCTGRLSDEVFAKDIKPHPVDGRHIVSHISGHQNGVCDVVGLHHVWCSPGNEAEKFRSYPDEGRHGDELPLVAGIGAVADVYDACASTRPYHEAFEQAKVVGIIRDGRGNHFQLEPVDAFLEALDQGFMWRGMFVQMPATLSR